MDRLTGTVRALVAALVMCAASGLPAVAQPGVQIIDAFDIGFDPTEITVPAPGSYSFAIENSGAIDHDLTFPDRQVAAADPGEQSATLEVDVPAEGLAYWCSVPGHREAGMEGFIAVAGGAPGVEGPVPDVEPDPNVPAPAARSADAPERPDATSHDISLTIQELAVTIAPGYQVAAWTFGGTVPGPTIRVRVGDQVTVRINNAATNQLAHSVDFHSSQVAPNGPMRAIAPGEQRVYQWTARHAGVFVYTGAGSVTGGSMLDDVANGLYGMVIVEPRGGMPAARQELAFVQSEWFVQGQGQTASLSKALSGSPDFVVFNGIADQYQGAPISVDVDETVRMYVANAGPTQTSAFRVQGTVFDHVVTEGVELIPGNPGSWGAATLNLAPGQGALVEMQFRDDGRYPFFSQALDQSARGARGVIVAGTGG
jgi:nitrite reductase (NO-forming)